MLLPAPVAIAGPISAGAQPHPNPAAQQGFHLGAVKDTQLQVAGVAGLLVSPSIPNPNPLQTSSSSQHRDGFTPMVAQGDQGCAQIQIGQRQLGTQSDGPAKAWNC